MISWSLGDLLKKTIFLLVVGKRNICSGFHLYSPHYRVHSPSQLFKITTKTTTAVPFFTTKKKIIFFSKSPNNDLSGLSDLSDFKIPGQFTAEKSATAINLRLPEHQFDLGFTIERRDKLVPRGFTNEIIFFSKLPKDPPG